MGIRQGEPTPYDYLIPILQNSLTALARLAVLFVLSSARRLVILFCRIGISVLSAASRLVSLYSSSHYNKVYKNKVYKSDFCIRLIFQAALKYKKKPLP